MDIHLSTALGTSPGTWYGMQTSFDRWHAQKRFRGKVQLIVVVA